MELPALDMLLFLVVTGFVAAFIDSIVGGGGLISVPALLFTGLPPNLVLGTNKLGGTMSSLTSTISFLFSGKIDRKLGMRLFPLSFLGAIGGTYLVHLVPPEFMKPLVVILLAAVLIYTLLKKNWGGSASFAGLTGWRATALAAGALALGFYDGFFGPGTGSFIIFMFLFFGFDFVGASANAKVLNFGSNLASLGTFIALGSVNWYYGLPMGIAMIGGALVGSQLAVRKGTAYVKPLFIIVTTILIGKQLWGVLAG
ncbi:sulfite exporter TauE/SafE family protein [Paenibacillus chartarius]|uniref:Probable membrane transporter protein n=1 Tax=Paenibacillus chartarius TaxID=747481 RepID=A0ABV6DMB1_9BACL